MKALWFVIAAIVGAVVFCLAAVIACCRIAGQCSREEQLKPCPVCKKIPRLGYCCGEYFIAGDDPDCPGCGTAFAEMHSSPQLEIDAWNRRADNA